MITKNNWLRSNIDSRLVDPSTNIDLVFDLYPFKDISFLDAANHACSEIYNDHRTLFLALSGGVDSEYVLRAFHRMKIPIQPIIVCCGNEEENKRAHELCNELSITPVVINVSEQDFLYYFLEYIYKKLNGVGYNSTQLLFAQEYASRNNGIVIAGEHLIYDDDSTITNKEYLVAHEWDFYGSSNFDGNIINFFTYTPELVYSMFPKIQTQWNIHRSILYNIPLRNKIRATYSDPLNKILKTISSNPWTHRTTKTLSKDQCLTIFQKYVS